MKSLCERLPDSQNSIVKKEKVRVKGFLIARVPSSKKKEFIMKKEEFCVKGFVIARILS
jgi:hypothetical protein